MKEKRDRYVNPFRFPLQTLLFTSINFPMGWMRIETLKKKLEGKNDLDIAFIKKFTKDELKQLKQLVKKYSD
jgi:hypothetical protein